MGIIRFDFFLQTGATTDEWRRIAKCANKRLVHVPLAKFSQETVDQLRTFHVLNGQEVRSYADHFIRRV